MTEETLSARAVALALERYKGRPEVAAEVERRISEPMALARIRAARDGLTAATMGEALKSPGVREAEALARLVDAAAGAAPRAPAVTPAAPEAHGSASASPAARHEAVAVPLQRQRHQEAEILRVLRELGRDPTALTRNDPGKAGPKAAVRQRLGHLPGWGVSVFNKAWERLRESGDIKDA